MAKQKSAEYTKSIQLRFNLNKETDRRLYVALEQSLLGATSAAVKHAVTLMLMQMQSQGQPQAVVLAPAPVQPQAPAPVPPAHSALVAAEPAVIKPVPQPIPEPKFEQIEPQKTAQNAAQNVTQNASNFDQKPASENQVQNDVSQIQPVIKVTHNFG